MKRAVHFVPVLAAALLLTSCAGNGGDEGPDASAGDSPGDAEESTDDDEVTEVRFASVGGITDAGIYVADERGYFAEEGLEVERLRIASAPDLTTALATGEIEAGGIALTPGLFNSVREGINLRVVGDKQSLSEGTSATWFAARPEFAVEGDTGATLENLRGQSVAVSARANAVYKMLNDLLEAYGMELDDVEVVELGYGDMAAALQNESVQAAILIEPFLVNIVEAGDVVPVSDLTEVIPEEGVTLVPLVYSDDFAQTDQAHAFMRAYMRGVRDYNAAFVDGVDQDEIVDIIAEYAELDRETIIAAQTAGLHPDQLVTQQYMEDTQEFFVEMGTVTDPVDVSDLVDTSFADAAVDSLGPS